MFEQGERFNKLQPGSVIPPQLAICLLKPPLHSGLLQKLSSSWPTQWQTRYFHICPPFLIYYEFGSSNNPGNLMTPSFDSISIGGNLPPQGYLDLRHVQAITLLDHHHPSSSNKAIVMIMKSNSEIRLRVISESLSFNNKSNKQDALKDGCDKGNTLIWFESLNEARLINSFPPLLLSDNHNNDYNEEEANFIEKGHGRRSIQGLFSYLSNRLSIGVHNDEFLDDIENSVSPPHHRQTIPHDGNVNNNCVDGIELTSNNNNDNGSTYNLQDEDDDVYNGKGYKTDDGLPPLISFCLKCIGAYSSSRSNPNEYKNKGYHRIWEGNKKKWVIRFLLICLLVYDSSMRFIYNPTPFRCSNSIIYQVNKPFPCLLFYAFYLNPILWNLTNLLSLLWLINGGGDYFKKKYSSSSSSSSSSSPSRKKIYNFDRMRQLNTFSNRCLYYVSFIAITFILISFLMAPVEEYQSFTGVLFVLLYIGLDVGLTLWKRIPIFLITLLYYTEYQQLKGLLQDWFQSLHEQYHQVSDLTLTYLSLHYEWIKIQNKISRILNIACLGLSLILLSRLLESFYYINGKVPTLINLDNFYGLFGDILLFLPLQGVMIFITVQINYFEVKLNRECNYLLTVFTTMLAPVMLHNQYRSRSSLFDGVVSADGGSGSGGGGKEGVQGGRGSSGGGGRGERGAKKLLIRSNSDWNTLCQMNKKLEMIRLMALIQQRPIQFYLLGRKVTYTDIYYLIGFLIFVQIINVFGVGWLVPL